MSKRPYGASVRVKVYAARLVLFAFLFAVLMILSSVAFFIALNIGSGGKYPIFVPNINAASPHTLAETAEDKEIYTEVFKELVFISDLSDYERYMNPENRDEYLILINVDNPLDKSYVPDDLIDVVDTRKDPGRATQKMREYAAKALEAMMIELRANGFNDVTVTSAYRSYEFQESLFNARVATYPNLSREEAHAKTAAVIAIPGTSEHQSGMCADIHNLPSADISFSKQPAAAWLAENCHKFGYILRYPEDKTEITKISFEPWHFRYVGRYHATAMYELGLCFEEYMEYLE